ncbi:MAG: ribonuclease P protein component [Bacteroidales bacterium]|nr:ribonuclease P protein component [Bacteroidales bacterium]
MDNRFFFRKSERIHEKTLIQKLFTQGKTIIIPPFRVQLLVSEAEANPPARILISIPKKVIRKAVKRNLLKRRIREAYRLNSHKFKDYLSAKKISLSLGFIYVEGQVADYHSIEKSLLVVLDSVIGKIERQRK